MITRILSLIFLFASCTFFGQKINYSVLTLNDSLKHNANVVIRSSDLNINITAQDQMSIKSKIIITVLNDKGLEDLSLMEYYDKNRKISKIEATVYDSFGNEIKTYKRKDFKDQSVADGVSIFNDNRMLFLDYTPVSYPFTMVYESEVQTSNTAFIPSWSPVDDYLVSTENKSITIQFKPELNLIKKEVNFTEKLSIDKTENTGTVTYTAKNIFAKKREELSPEFTKIFPIVYFALENFQLENVNGKATDWKEFGKWYYDKLLSDTEELSDDTKQKIKQLVGVEKDPIKIAKIVYQFVQDKTRYVSVQVGIGGWKPMLAKDVDKFGYGDCKALTNYTRSLLKYLDIPSYFTVVYAGSGSTRDLKEDIASIQGNHAILTLPTNNGNQWLECTSQIHPFGFQGDFTDDRKVLVIKPDGGEIISTKTFSDAENLKTINGSYSIDANGNLKGNFKAVSRGLQYDNEFMKERKSREEQIERYKYELDNINNLKINKISLNNNKNSIEFIEELEISAEGYAQNSGGKLMFTINAFDQSSYVPKKYKNREFPFEIERGYTDEDVIEISIPDGFIVEAKPNNNELITEFGTYKIEFETISTNKMICKRKLVTKKGFFEKEKYESYRKFRETIVKTDNSKTIISKI